MLAKMLPLFLLLIGLAAGGGAGLVLKPEPESAQAEHPPRITQHRDQRPTKAVKS